MARKMRGVDVSEISLGDAAEMVAPTRVGPEPRIPTGVATPTSFSRDLVPVNSGGATPRLDRVAKPPTPPYSPNFQMMSSGRDLVPVAGGGARQVAESVGSYTPQPASAAPAGPKAPGTALQVVPQRPNFTRPGIDSPVRSAPAAPSTALQNVPQQPNFTRPGVDSPMRPQPPSFSARAGAAAGRVAGTAAAGLRDAASEAARLSRQVVGGPNMYARGRGLGALASAATPALVAAESGTNTFNTPTEDYRRRFGMDPNASSGFLEDVAVRGAGAVTDLGATLLDAPVNVANAVGGLFGAPEMKLPGGSFRDIVTRQDAAPAATAAAPTVAPPSTNQTAATEQRLGAKMASDAGGGRGSETNYGAQLASLPSNLDFLPSGDVFKTKDANGRTVYSGRNVKEGADIREGFGRKTGSLNNDLRGGGLQTLDANGRPTNTVGRAGFATGMQYSNGGEVPYNSNVAVAQRMGLNREATAGAAQAQQGPTVIGFGGTTAGQNIGGDGSYGIRDQSLGAQLRRVSRDYQTATDPRERAAAGKQVIALSDAISSVDGRLSQDASNIEQERIRAEGGIAQERIRAGATRAAGSAANARLAFEQQEAERKRGLVREAVAANRGDFQAAARQLAASGQLDMAREAQTLGAGEQTASDARNASARKNIDDTAKLFEGETSYVDPKTGQLTANPAAARVRADILNKLSPNFDSLPPEEKNRQRMQASLLARVYEKTTANKVTGLDAINPFAEEPPRPELLPDFTGGSLERLGLGRGAVTAGISKGEYQFTDKNGRSINVGNLSEQELQLFNDLIKNGVTTKGSRAPAQTR